MFYVLYSFVIYLPNLPHRVETDPIRCNSLLLYKQTPNAET
jgi:hypothetical protein